MPDMYKNLKEQDHLEMFQKTSLKTDLKVYGFAWGIVVFGLLPWAVGACMLIKWGFQAIF